MLVMGGGFPLKIELNIDPDCPEPRVIVYARRMTPELEALLHRLSEPTPETVAVQTERGVELLPMEEIMRVYSERQKVYVQTAAGVYSIRARLYEMEKRLEGHAFARISSSELVNTRMITGMDFSLAGTIRLSLKGGVTTYVSRRRMNEIKRIFDV